MKPQGFDRRRLDDLRRELQAPGSAPGASGPAPVLVRRWDEAWAAIAGRVPAGGMHPRVFIEEWHQPPMAAQSWVPDLVRRAGGEPFVVTPGSLNQEISWEEVMEFDPHIVILSLHGIGLQAAPEQWMDIEGWDRVDAAAQGRVFSVDDRLFNQPGMALAEGAGLLQGLIGEAFWGWPRCEDARLRRLQGLENGFKKY